jgi:hypothetical protein
MPTPSPTSALTTDEHCLAHIAATYPAVPFVFAIAVIALIPDQKIMFVDIIDQQLTRSILEDTFGLRGFHPCS